MGVDPVTHKPQTGGSTGSASHLVQWETARLEAEARLAGRNRHVAPSLKHGITVPVVAPPPCLDVVKVWQATSSTNSFFESPASTLYFSGPDGISGGANGFVSMKYSDHEVMMTGYSNTGVGSGVEFEDDNSYLNELLNLVSTPVGISPYLP